MKSLIALRAILVFLMAVLLPGCSSKNQPVEVEGIVVLDNVPVAEATVLSCLFKWNMTR